ncbi:MAG: hypothetical protein U0X91_28445 [Spirosomataceae bacterium]
MTTVFLIPIWWLISFTATSFKNILPENNYFELSKGSTLLRCDSVLTVNLPKFKGNQYKSATKIAPVVCKKCSKDQVAALQKTLTN